MKKNIWLSVLCFCLTCSLVACFEDDSTLGNASVPGIEISKIENKAIVSYSGNHLQVTPQVKTEYAEGELKYTWYIYDANATVSDDVADKGYRREVISQEKNLDYDVKLSSGAYTVVCEVSHVNSGLTATTSFTLNVTTSFSQGFYLLKETADGNTDLDLLVGDAVSHDLISSMQGAPMQGKPINMSMMYAQSYINDDTQELESTNMLNLFAENDYRALRTEDLKLVFDKSNICFDALTSEVPYTYVRGFFTSYFLTSKGIYSSNTVDVQPSSGRYGVPVATGASRFFQSINGGMGCTYWNDEKHCIYDIDYNGIKATPDIIDGTSAGVVVVHQECVASGTNYVGSAETTWYVSQDKESGARYFWNVSARTVTPLAADSHMAKGTSIAGNGLKANLIYVIDENKLWAYNWNTGEEYAVNLPGVGSDETLNYVTNQFLNVGGFGDQSANMDNLIICTTKGSDYKAYFFSNLVGGQPNGEASAVASGQGTIKAVRFAAAVSIKGTDYMMAGYGYGPIHQYGD